MVEKNPPKGVSLTESVMEDFLNDDFKISDKVPALYEEHCKKGLIKKGKLTPARYEAIIKYVRSGACITHAANAVGIDNNTLNGWLRRGEEEPDSIYALFLDDFRRAKSFAVIRNIGIVQRAAVDDWNAAKWLLSVLEPEIYGNKSVVKTEITGANGEPFKTEIIISDDELKKLTTIQAMIDEQNNIVDAEYKVIDDNDDNDKSNETF